MDQTFGAPRVGQLIRQVARPELRSDGYPVSFDHVFAVWTGDETAPLYPVRVTVETAVAEGSGQSVLLALETAARSILQSRFAVRMSEATLLGSSE